MNREVLRKKWNGMSAEILSDRVEWQAQHPMATFREIKAEVDKRLSELRVQMLSDAAMMSEEERWKVGEKGRYVRVVGRNWRRRGRRSGSCKRGEGRRWNWSGNMPFVRRVGKGFFPLDEALGLLPGILTPHGHECLVRLAGWMPFGKAAEMLEDFLGIHVSPIVSQKYTEAAGEAYVRLQEKEVQRLEKERPPAEKGGDKIQISADGAMAPLVHGVWTEVKTLVVGEVQPPVEEKGEQVLQTHNLSYFSRKVNAEEFQRLALVEIHRRGFENAQEVAAIMDGAEWEQGFTDYHCPQAKRILDFPHAAEHINEVGEFLYDEHTPESQAWLSERLHHFKQAGPEERLYELENLHSQHPQAEVISGHLAYLEKRKEQMQYPQFQAQGWPIG